MLTFFLLTAGFLVLFIILLLFGIVKKRRKPIYLALVFFLLAIPAGIYTGFLFAQTAYKKIKTTKIENPFKRSGREIYKAVLGEPTGNCLTVTNSQDQYIPKVDCCIWLEFTACPKEIERIIAAKGLTPFVSSEVRYNGDSTEPRNKEYIDNTVPDYSPKPAWFTPDSLGAGSKIMRKHNMDDPNHDLILYISRDSTRAYYCDMAE